MKKKTMNWEKFWPLPKNRWSRSGDIYCFFDWIKVPMKDSLKFGTHVLIMLELTLYTFVWLNAIINVGILKMKRITEWKLVCDKARNSLTDYLFIALVLHHVCLAPKHITRMNLGNSSSPFQGLGRILEIAGHDFHYTYICAYESCSPEVMVVEN